MWSGLESLIEIDYNHEIQGEYIREWRHVSGFDFYTHFKSQEYVSKKQEASYGPVFDLLNQMLTLDYKYRPMAKELLDHQFFQEEA